MEDKRIVKTKMMLQQSLLELLKEKTFGSITVKEICEKASTSRITFYTHYDDKYALLQGIFQNGTNNIVKRFKKLQKKNNPDDNLILRCQNIVDAVFSDQMEGGMAQIVYVQRENNDLILFYFREIRDKIMELEKVNGGRWNNLYPIKPLTSFFVAGFTDYTLVSMKAGKSIEDIRHEILSLVRDILIGNLAPDAEEDSAHDSQQ